MHTCRQHTRGSAMCTGLMKQPMLYNATLAQNLEGWANTRSTKNSPRNRRIHALSRNPWTTVIADPTRKQGEPSA